MPIAKTPESYSVSISSEFVNIGILYSSYKKNLNSFYFTSMLIEAQKTETFKKIAYLPGLNYDYDIFIHDHVPFYIAITFFLFDGNLNAQKYIFNIAIEIIRNLKVTDNYIFGHHVSWGLLMSSSNKEFSNMYNELRNLTNKRNGILDTILYCPTFLNDHYELLDSILINVPGRTEYLEKIKEKFEHVSDNIDIHTIAIMSLSDHWKDDLEYHINLGVDLTNYVIKNIMISEWNQDTRKDDF